MLDGKKLLITGVVNRESIAYEVAAQAQEAGAEVVLTSFGRVRRMTERSATKLDRGRPTCSSSTSTAPRTSRRWRTSCDERWGRVDGILHAIAFAPEDALGGNFLNTPVESAEVAFQTSAFSLKALAAGLADLYPEEGASVVGLDFDASVAWPVLRLDGRGQGRAGGDLALPGARPRSARRAREPRVGGPAGHAGGARHPGLRRPRDGVAAAGAARLGHRRSGARGGSDPVPAQRPGPRRHRRDPARRRRLPRDGTALAR